MKRNEAETMALPAGPGEREYLLAAGQEVGSTRIVRPLGRGAMGEVYLADHLNLHIPVAVKILAPNGQAIDSQFAERFLREARLAAALRNPNTVQVLDVERDPGTGCYYIIMEYVEGITAAERICDEGPMDESQAVAILRGVATALKAAAQHRIVHRDIKPSNILLCRDGTIKLADLGIAKQQQHGRTDPQTSTELTQEGMLIGTPAYMSPEQVRSARTADTRSDLYSLGATFYYLLIGELPYQGETTFAILTALIEQPVPDPRLKRPGLSPQLSRLCMGLMSKNPDDRPQTPEILLNELDRLGFSRGDQSAMTFDSEKTRMPLDAASTLVQAHATASTPAAPVATRPELRPQEKSSPVVTLLLLVCVLAFLGLGGGLAYILLTPPEAAPAKEDSPRPEELLGRAVEMIPADMASPVPATPAKTTVTHDPLPVQGREGTVVVVDTLAVDSAASGRHPATERSGPGELMRIALVPVVRISADKGVPESLIGLLRADLRQRFLSSNKFEVIERDDPEIVSVGEELAFGDAANITDARRTRLGEIAGVEHLVFLSIDDYDCSLVESGFRIAKERQVLRLRLGGAVKILHASSARIVYESPCTITLNAGKGDDASALLRRGVAELSVRAAELAVDKFYPVTLIHREGGMVLLNRGLASLKAGDRFTVLRLRPITDPGTGAVSYAEIPVGQVCVTVPGETTSPAEVILDEGIESGCIARRLVESPRTATPLTPVKPKSVVRESDW